MFDHLLALAAARAIKSRQLERARNSIIDDLLDQAEFESDLGTLRALSGGFPGCGSSPRGRIKSQRRLEAGDRIGEHP
jgi:hypothetical protein